jgi:nucleotide-binding universal stress UspA family protein
LTAQPKASPARPKAPEIRRRQILVPFDFSQSSINALRHAAGVAANNKANLTVVNVIDEPLSFRTLDKVGQQHDRQQKRCEQLRQAARREIGRDVPTRLVICEGNPSEEITRLAGEQNADLIVVGEHEHRGLRRWFRRNIAKKVVAAARCPVMVLGRGQAESMTDRRAA